MNNATHVIYSRNDSTFKLICHLLRTSYELFKNIDFHFLYFH
jgi:hypothetical protein